MSCLSKLTLETIILKLTENGAQCKHSSCSPFHQLWKASGAVSDGTPGPASAWQLCRHTEPAWLTRALHPLPLQPPKVGGTSPQGLLGLLFNTVCSTLVSRLETFGEVLQCETQPWDTSHTLNNSCYSQSSTHKLQGGKRKEERESECCENKQCSVCFGFWQKKKMLLEMKIKSR